MLEQGWRHLNEGRLEDADRICRQALETDPDNAEAWHLLAMANVRLGRFDVAESSFLRAVGARPDFLALALASMARTPRRAGPIHVEISPGELLDKITILKIKRERIADAAKLANVESELAMLEASRDRAIVDSDELAGLTAELRGVNEALWQVEDELRRCERAGDFGPRFIELARSVYRLNDRRAAIKRQINEKLGSRLTEEKSYQVDS
jgi:tetratricopeptide (TPR) repeat protein